MPQPNACKRLTPTASTPPNVAVTATPASERLHVQPWTVRTPMTSSTTAQTHEPVEEPGHRRPGTTAVRTACAEQVLAVDRHPDGPVDEEREGDRRSCKGEQVTRATEAAAAA